MRVIITHCNSDMTKYFGLNRSLFHRILFINRTRTNSTITDVISGITFKNIVRI